MARPSLTSRTFAWLWLWLVLFAVSSALAQIEITEFMAINNTTLNDEDGDNSDWIEVHNAGTMPLSLAGWCLTDSTNNLVKWQFPATNLAANAYLVVFASEKNRRVPGAPLHTSFKLAGEGEYLALVKPDGVSVATEFAPAFPPQVADVSYGRVRNSAPLTLVDTGAVVRAFVPANPNLGLTWAEGSFDDTSWASGVGGVGYDRQPTGVNFLPWIGLNVESQMFNVNGSIFVRLLFTLDELPELDSLTLQMKFEDGFVAYLNGVEVARSNAPAILNWNSIATAPRTDTAATNFVDFDLSSERDLLQLGENVLAFQALNNPTNSPDLLLLSQLVASTPFGPPALRYFPSSTPGRANQGGVEVLGPILTELAHAPAVPTDAQDLTVSARLRPAFGPVASATLQYRVMFGGEVSVPFLDDGAHGDGAANDGMFGARIPASASTPGQMVRWYVTARDGAGRVSRYPAFSNTNSSPAYLGTVVANPALTNALPVFHWFVQNTAAADAFAGTRASVFYAGEFYDNVFNRVRGASAPTFPKKPYKFDFNPGAHFRYRPDAPRVDEINLNATYQDKALVRQTLTYETYQDSGVPASDCFSVRVERNGAFYSVALLTEQLDETFLEKRGLDPAGALYKIYNGINSANSGVEKKTRRHENNSDLQQLVDGIALNNPRRGTNLFDLLDLPEIINYLAAGVVAQDWDRAVKNIYLYRDSNGTRLWQMFPWDKDLSFGKVGLVNDAVTAIKDGTTGASGEPYISHPFYGQTARNCCGVNNLFDAVYATPVTREMFLRRLRTLMDELLQPPGTPSGQLRYETKLDRLFASHQADAALDLAKWGAGYGVSQTLVAAMTALRSNYLAARRNHLYLTHSVAAGTTNVNSVRIPGSQTAAPALTFGAIEFSPASGDQRQEFVEILNPNPTAVDVSGWRVEGGIQFTFAHGTVIPAGRAIYLSPDVVSFKLRSASPRGGQGLLVVGNYQGQLSARGESLRLLDNTGTNVTAVTFPGAPSAAQQFFRITEIMYHPEPPPLGNTNSPENFEYIELKNTGAGPLDLSGVRFTNGIEFQFSGSAMTTLSPGAAVLVVKHLVAFTARYGSGANRPVAGVYQGSLDNNGERLQLLDARNEEILDFSYNNTWYPVTDGLGFSLVVVDENADPDQWGNRVNWRPSGLLNGTPGTTDPGAPAVAPIVVNEVLSRSDPPAIDAIELHNPTSTNVDVSGWFLTDDPGVPRKFRIPDHTLMAGGGFVVFTETNFNVAPGLSGNFSFSSDDDEAFLFSADLAGRLTGYSHGFRFGAAVAGVSFGRHLTSIGEEHFVAQIALTLGETNAGPTVGPVIISEIQYHPSCASGAIPCGADEEDIFAYIELQNISSGPVTLADPILPGMAWRLREGVEFEFPANVSIGAHEVILVVGFDPTANLATASSFRAAYGLNAAVRLFGPYRGQLDHAGDRLELQKPESSDATGPGVINDVLVDAVHYHDAPPWPVAADGQGASLQRTPVEAYGDDPASWAAADPSPGGSLTAGLFWAPPNILRWSVSLSNFELQSATTLSSGSWITDTTARTTNGNSIEVSVPRTDASRFFRLIKR